MKKFIVLFIFLFFVATLLNAKEYTEDNAAYWYKKAYDLLPDLSYSEKEIVYGMDSVKDAKKLDETIKTKLINPIKKGFIDNLKTAKKKTYCVLFKESKSAANIKNQWFNYWQDKMDVSQVVAELLFAEDKQEAAAYIVLNMYDMCRKTNFHSNAQESKMFLLNRERQLIGLMSLFCQDGAKQKVKEGFVKYIKAIPTPPYDLREITKNHYNKLIKTTLERIEADHSNAFFILENDFIKEKPKSHENSTECEKHIELLNGALEMLYEDYPEYEEQSPEKLIDYLNKNAYIKIRDSIKCPEGGKYILVKKQDFPLSLTCSCNDTSSVGKNSKQIQIIEDYMTNTYPIEKEKLINYYEELIKFDHNQPFSKNDFNIKFGLETYGGNKLLTKLAFDYVRSRNYNDDYKEKISDFLKKYDK